MTKKLGKKCRFSKVSTTAIGVLMMTLGRRIAHRLGWIRCSSFFALLLIAVPPVETADKYQKMINCDLHNSICRQELADGVVTLEVSPKPVKALTDLTFKVSFSGNVPAGTTALYIDLGMPGMNMGPNRVRLTPADDGIYKGKGIIVKCPSGRRIWQATVTVPKVGTTAFVFDVIY